MNTLPVLNLALSFEKFQMVTVTNLLILLQGTVICFEAFTCAFLEPHLGISLFGSYKKVALRVILVG